MEEKRPEWPEKGEIIFSNVELKYRPTTEKVLKGLSFKIKGGGFLFYNFDTKINEGNLDRELMAYLGWELLNSDFSVNNNLGYGYHFGAEYIVYFSKKFGISLEAYYLSGSSPLDMKGTYKGIPVNGDMITEESVSFKDAQLDFTGYELSIGVIFTP